MSVGCVYVFQEGNTRRIKIGITTGDPNKRIKQLQTGNSRELSLKAHWYCQNPRKLESYLHSKFDHRKRKGEWFYMNEKDRQELWATARGFLSWDKP